MNKKLSLFIMWVILVSFASFSEAKKTPGFLTEPGYELIYPEAGANIPEWLYNPEIYQCREDFRTYSGRSPIAVSEQIAVDEARRSARETAAVDIYGISMKSEETVRKDVSRASSEFVDPQINETRETNWRIHAENIRFDKTCEMFVARYSKAGKVYYKCWFIGGISEENILKIQDEGKYNIKKNSEKSKQDRAFLYSQIINTVDRFFKKFLKDYPKLPAKPIRVEFMLENTINANFYDDLLDAMRSAVQRYPKIFTTCGEYEGRKKRRGDRLQRTDDKLIRVPLMDTFKSDSQMVLYAEPRADCKGFRISFDAHDRAFDFTDSRSFSLDQDVCDPVNIEITENIDGVKLHLSRMSNDLKEVVLEIESSEGKKQYQTDQNGFCKVPYGDIGWDKCRRNKNMRVMTVNDFPIDRVYRLNTIQGQNGAQNTFCIHGNNPQLEEEIVKRLATYWQKIDCDCHPYIELELFYREESYYFGKYSVSLTVNILHNGIPYKFQSIDRYFILPSEKDEIIQQMSNEFVKHVNLLYSGN